MSLLLLFATMIAKLMNNKLSSAEKVRVLKYAIVIMGFLAVTEVANIAFRAYEATLNSGAAMAQIKLQQQTLSILAHVIEFQQQPLEDVPVSKIRQIVPSDLEKKNH